MACLVGYLSDTRVGVLRVASPVAGPDLATSQAGMLSAPSAWTDLPRGGWPVTGAEEAQQQGDDSFVGVFLEVVADVRQAEDLCLRESLQP